MEKKKNNNFELYEREKKGRKIADRHFASVRGSRVPGVARPVRLKNAKVFGAGYAAGHDLVSFKKYDLQQ